MFGAGEVETATVVRPPGTDGNGDPTGPAVEHPEPGCLYAPGHMAERNTGGDQVIADATLFAPPGADIAPTDRIRVRGLLHTIVGAPRRWGSRGVEVLLRRVTG